MNFERYCGMATASILLLTVALTILKPSEGAATILTVVGVAIAVGAAYLAWSKSQEQIEIAQAQLSAQQEQIDDARRTARQSRFEMLDRQFRQLADEIETLMTASAYLKTLANEYPEDGAPQSSFGAAMRDVRKRGLDALSATAARAPLGFGPQIETTIGRLTVVGERMQSSFDQQGSLNHVLVTQYYPGIQTYVAGIRSIADQIDHRLPQQRAELVRLANERDMFSDHADLTTSPRL